MNELVDDVLRCIRYLPFIEDSEILEGRICIIACIRDILQELGVEDERIYRLLDFIPKAVAADNVYVTGNPTVELKSLCHVSGPFRGIITPILTLLTIGN